MGSETKAKKVQKVLYLDEGDLAKVGEACARWDRLYGSGSESAFLRAMIFRGIAAWEGGEASPVRAAPAERTPDEVSREEVRLPAGELDRLNLLRAKVDELRGERRDPIDDADFVRGLLRRGATAWAQEIEPFFDGEAPLGPSNPDEVAVERWHAEHPGAAGTPGQLARWTPPAPAERTMGDVARAFFSLAPSEPGSFAERLKKLRAAANEAIGKSALPFGDLEFFRGILDVGIAEWDRQLSEAPSRCPVKTPLGTCDAPMPCSGHAPRDPDMSATAPVMTGPPARTGSIRVSVNPERVADLAAGVGDALRSALEEAAEKIKPSWDGAIPGMSNAMAAIAPVAQRAADAVGAMLTWPKQEDVLEVRPPPADPVRRLASSPEDLADAWQVSDAARERIEAEIRELPHEDAERVRAAISDAMRRRAERVSPTPATPPAPMDVAPGSPEAALVAARGDSPADLKLAAEHARRRGRPRDVDRVARLSAQAAALGLDVRIDLRATGGAQVMVLSGSDASTDALRRDLRRVALVVDGRHGSPTIQDPKVAS